MNLQEKIGIIEHSLQKEWYTISAKECVCLIEQAFQQLFCEYLTQLDEKDRLKVQEIEREIGGGQKGIESFTMGQLIGVFRKSRFLDALARVSNREINSIRMINLDELNNLRNELIHGRREATHTEAEFLFQCLQVILKTFDISGVEDNRKIFKQEAKSLIILPTIDVPTFTGRMSELERLAELLIHYKGDKASSIVSLSGTGGIGKTTLACHFAEIYKEYFPDGIIGLNVKGKKDIGTIAREFARCCGAEINMEDKRSAATIMQDLFSHRRTLLIFDNVDNTTIRALLPRGNKCKVIITTRDRSLPVLLNVKDEAIINLPTLPKQDAIALLKNFLGTERVESERKATEDIVALVGNLPLALEIVGKQLKMQLERKLADYANLLREERERLNKLKIRKADDLDVRASFSLSLKELGEDEVSFFACLSVCAKGEFSVQTAMAVSNCNQVVITEDRLNCLYQFSLLNRSQPIINRYYFHPLIHLFAHELAVEKGLLADAEERHAEYFVKLIISADIKDYNQIALFADDMDNIILAAEWLISQRRPAYEFIIKLKSFFKHYVLWQEAIRLTSGFLELAESDEDWKIIVQLRIQISKYELLYGNMDKAKNILAPIENILGKIKARNIRQHCEVKWLTTLGRVYSQRKSTCSKAIKIFRRCYNLSVELKKQSGQAKILNSLGTTFKRLEQYPEAIETLKKCAEINKQSGNKRGQAIVLNSLGGVLHKQKNYDEAEKVFRHSAEIEKQIGNLRGQAMVYLALGKCLFDNGDYEKSIVELLKSFEINEKLKNQIGISVGAPSIIRALIKLNRRDEAKDYYQRTIAIVPNNKYLFTLCDRLFATKTWLIQGSIKHYYKSERCYGFIVPDDGSEDIYFDKRYINSDCLVKLSDKVRVKVEVEQGPKGPRAKHITVLTNEKS